jgi:hypothetical protein
MEQVLLDVQETEREPVRRPIIPLASPPSIQALMQVKDMSRVLSL